MPKSSPRVNDEWMKIKNDILYFLYLVFKEYELSNNLREKKED